MVIIKSKSHTDDLMTEYVEKFRSKIDESGTRAAFPEITDSETPVWRSGPSTLSMADKYILSEA